MASVTPAPRIRFYLSDLGINRDVLAKLATVNEALHTLRMTGAPSADDGKYRSKEYDVAEARFHLTRALQDFVAKHERQPGSKNEDVQGTKLIDSSKDSKANLPANVLKVFAGFPQNARVALTALQGLDKNIALFAEKHALMQSKIQFNQKAFTALGHVCDKVVLEIYNDTAANAVASKRKTLSLDLVPAVSSSPLRSLYASLPRFQALLAREARRRASTSKTFDDDEVAAGFARKVKDNEYVWPAIDEQTEDPKYNFKSFIKKLIKNHPQKGTYNMSASLNNFLSSVLADLIQSYVPAIRKLNAYTNKKFKNINENTIALMVANQLTDDSVVSDLVSTPVPQVVPEPSLTNTSVSGSESDAPAPSSDVVPTPAPSATSTSTSTSGNESAPVAEKAETKKRANRKSKEVAPTPAPAPSSTAPVAEKKKRGGKKA